MFYYSIYYCRYSKITYTTIWFRYFYSLYRFWFVLFFNLVSNFYPVILKILVYFFGRYSIYLVYGLVVLPFGLSSFFVMLCILILLPPMKISCRYVFWLWIIQTFALPLLQRFQYYWLLTISCYYYFASETSQDKLSIFPCLPA